ncbi:MAG: sulfurtransferase TusA family protein [Deltaproteobacteria bacterium]|nr:sulfurtransferase TusA family protein [Deltaproteobacteria bacterium]
MLQAAELDLDITGDVCPMTLVRVRMALGHVAPGGTLRVKMAAGEPVSSIPRTLRDEGHEIVSVEKTGEAFDVTFRLKG